MRADNKHQKRPQPPNRSRCVQFNSIQFNSLKFHPFNWPSVTQLTPRTHFDVKHRAVQTVEAAQRLLSLSHAEVQEELVLVLRDKALQGLDHVVAQPLKVHHGQRVKHHAPKQVPAPNHHSIMLYHGTIRGTVQDVSDIHSTHTHAHTHAHPRRDAHTQRKEVRVREKIGVDVCVCMYAHMRTCTRAYSVNAARVLCRHRYCV